MERQYNMRSPAVKRLMKEAQELSEPTEQYYAQPLDDNLFEWHFTIRGPSDSAFGGGIYHGRILLPPEYPMKPPSIMLLTPNGRFETYKKICLSISGYHPESWQPSWSIRTALLAIIGFMPTHGGGAIGSLDYTPEERKVLAKKSRDWKCQTCGDVTKVLKVVTEASEKTQLEAKELASQINFQAEKQSIDNETKPTNNDSNSTTKPVATPKLNSTPTASVPPGPTAFPQMPFPPSFMFPLRPPPGQPTAPGMNSLPFMRPGFPIFPRPPGFGMPMMPPWLARMPGAPGFSQPSSMNNSASGASAPVSGASAPVSGASAPVSGASAPASNTNATNPVNNPAGNNLSDGLHRRPHVPSSRPAARNNPPAQTPMPTIPPNRQRDTQTYLTVIGLALCILVLLFRRLFIMEIWKYV